MCTKEFDLNCASKKKDVDISRILLIVGCALASSGFITSLLALTLPYWIHVTETMETTVAGLTDDTEVDYFYGLMRYCLVMKATHLDRYECRSRTLGQLEGQLLTLTSITKGTKVLTSLI